MKEEIEPLVSINRKVKQNKISAEKNHGLKNENQNLTSNLKPQHIQSSSSSCLNVNLCGGSTKFPGYVNVDIVPDADIVLDLEKSNLPFENSSVDKIVCISAINYLSKDRALEILIDIRRVLKPQAYIRIGVQDLEILAKHYVDKNQAFWFQKLSNGEERFQGRTFAEKFNQFFTGFTTSGNKNCKFVYDYETLALLMKDAGFVNIAKKNFGESDLEDLGKFDNRPEQMFFLEARAPSEYKQIKINDNYEEMTKEAIRLIENKKEEEGWQLMLLAINKCPNYRDAVIYCSQFLISKARYNDLERLCNSYLKHKSDDNEIRSLLNFTQEKIVQSKIVTSEYESNKTEILLLDKIIPTHKSSSQHLEACYNWLSHAQDVRPGGGVASLYSLVDKIWMEDYPETTGYIIPTYLALEKVLNNEISLQRAIKMGDWEIAIQHPEGGAGEPVGVYGLMPRVFNTSQVILGWIALYDKTSEGKYLEAAIKAANWIVKCQGNEGDWSTNDYQGARTYHARTAWALLEVYRITKNPTFLNSATLSIDWILKRAKHNGWFSETSLTEPDRPWTHLIAYTLVGLAKIAIHHPYAINPERIFSLLREAAFNLINVYKQRKKNIHSTKYIGFPGTLGQFWDSNDNWSCLTGDAQLAYFLALMGKSMQHPALLETASSINQELCNVHLLEVEDKNLYGALPGSYPIDGEYCTFSLPNWSVKFFADSLLAQSGFNDDQLLG